MRSGGASSRCRSWSPSRRPSAIRSCPSGFGNPNTYGPFTYLAYIPFELIWPNHGKWDDLPAAHAAAITFDLLTTWGMYVLGTRLREGDAGKAFGVVLAYAWDAFPYSSFVLESRLV